MADKHGICHRDIRQRCLATQGGSLVSVHFHIVSYVANHDNYCYIMDLVVLSTKIFYVANHDLLHNGLSRFNGLSYFLKYNFLV